MEEFVEDAALSFAAPFGIVLRTFRKKRGLRQLDLAVLLLTDHTQISRWESGARLPTSDEVRRLAVELHLTLLEAELLTASFQRSGATDPGDEARPAKDLEITLESVNRLRQLGQPRIAYELAQRDARAAIRTLRKRPGSSADLDHGLRQTSRLLLEEVKAALDFETTAAITGGLLAENRALHRLVTAGVTAPRVQRLLLVGDEATYYAAGNVDAAHAVAGGLMTELNLVDYEYRAELIRAEAINCGALNDGTGIAKAWDELLAVEEHLTPEQRSFVQEGFIRGFARLRPDKAFDLLTRQQEHLTSEQGSPVRWIQLVRAEAELHRTVFGSVNDGSAVRRAERGLAVARQHRLEKYEQLLVGLLGAE